MKNIIFKAYFEAIKIEYEHDALYHHYYSSKNNIKLIPKPFAVKKILLSLGNLINFIIPFIIPFWIFLIHPLMVVLYLTKYLISSLSSKKEIISGSIYLDASDNKYFSTINNNEIGFPKTVITFPFRRSYSSPIPNIREINLFSLTNSLLFLKSTIYSFFVVWKLIFSSEKRMIFYSYTAFSWFLVYFTLRDQHIKSIWLSNNYDRWIGLVSKLPETEVTIVQHGQLYFYDHKNKVKLFPRFSQKIRNVNKIYTINKLSEKYFKLYIEDKGLEFLMMKSNLELIPWRTIRPLAYKVLVVGNHIQMPFQMKIIKELYSKYGNNIDICYKYHPRQTNQVTHKSLWEIRQKDILPKADIVISYGSSIDYEIEQIINCEIQYYNYLDNNSLPELICSIEKITNKLNNVFEVS